MTKDRRDPHRDPFWRALDELAGDPRFHQRCLNEFPSLLPSSETATDPIERRNFLKLMGASLALAGVTACTRQPPETIVPYVRQPEEIVPGNYYKLTPRSVVKFWRPA